MHGTYISKKLIVATLFVVSFLGSPSLFAKENPQYKNELLTKIENKSGSSLTELMDKHDVPGISIAVIKDRKLHWASGFGVKQQGKPDRVDTETMFSVGSISKVGTAVTTLRLVDQGKLDLDADVNQYLKNWKAPTSFNGKPVKISLTRLLSHTAGLSVHGFADFQPGEKLPTTAQILRGKSPAKNGAVELIIEPGTQYRYSGGGTTVVQMVLEDLLNQNFTTIAEQNLFKKLGMNRSSYVNPLPSGFENIAKAHSSWGNARALPRGYEAMPEMAASGLWTTPTDLSKILLSLMGAYFGDEQAIISQRTAKKMMQPVAPSQFGLGPRIKTDKIFQHGGANDSYKALFKVSLRTGNGYVVFTNGADGDELIDELELVMDEML